MLHGKHQGTGLHQDVFYKYTTYLGLDIFVVYPPSLPPLRVACFDVKDKRAICSN